jgi:hypothetical protein
MSISKAWCMSCRAAREDHIEVVISQYMLLTGQKCLWAPSYYKPLRCKHCGRNICATTYPEDFVDHCWECR